MYCPMYPSYNDAKTELLKPGNRAKIFFLTEKCTITVLKTQNSVNSIIFAVFKRYFFLVQVKEAQASFN